MVSFTSVHHWNSLLSPPLGFAFNAILLWLILRRTPKEMRVHSHILLQTCATDCLLLALQCIGQIAIAFDQKNFCFVQFFDGYFVRQFAALQNPLFLFYFQTVWIFFHNLSVIGTTAQFIYRYLVLNRNINISLCKYLLLLLGTSLCIFAATTLLLLGSFGSLNQKPIDRQNFEAFVDFDQKLLILITDEFKGNNLLFLVGLGNYAVLFILAYSAICFCGWKMVRFVNEHATLTGRMKELNRLLTKCLIILACIPLFTGFTSFALLSGIFFGHIVHWTLEWELYLMLTMHWLPVLNPLTTIYINRPYRDALLGCFVKIAPAANG